MYWHCMAADSLYSTWLDHQPPLCWHSPASLYWLYHHYRIIRHLGSGQFGTVNEGVWHCPWGKMQVAVKMLRVRAIEQEKVKLLQEAAIMGQFVHPNVVRLHGVVTVGEPVSEEACSTHRNL